MSEQINGQIGEPKRTSLFANGLIWFGAGVSIAEILTGTYFAPLGFQKGLLAIIIGHIIGCALFFMAGVIGGSMRKSSMESVKVSFGTKGGLLFALLNVIQLTGWTAIMIYDGALAANNVFNAGNWLWALIIGICVIVLIMIGIQNLGKVNTVVMAALFIMTAVLCWLIFKNGMPDTQAAGEAMSFGAAVELSVAMPLSWLPVVSDYTREAKKPVAAAAVSTGVYGLVSCWMYIIGMSAAIFTGESDIAVIMLKAGLGVMGLLIVILSTATTTFLDAFSAGVSSVSLSSKIKEKWAAVTAGVIGTICAMIFPMDDITDFLYLIGSVFAPMIAIQIADYFIIKRREVVVDGGKQQAFDAPALIVWVIGFLLYRYLMTVDIPVGNTLPDMVVTTILCIIVRKIVKR